MVIPAAETSTPPLAEIVLDNLTVAGQAEFAARLASLLPPSWFGTGLTVVDEQTPESSAPVLNTTLSGPAYNLAYIYGLYEYVLTQSRIATATGVWLDRISYDFLGNNLPRRSGEQDSQYRVRILKEILRPRQTVAAIEEALVDLTGIEPQVIELWNPGDVGCYYGDGFLLSTQGYDDAGMYGDLSLNNQFFVTAFRPAGGGVAEISGYGNNAGSYLPSEPKRFVYTPLINFGFYCSSPRPQFLAGGQMEYTADSDSTIGAADDEIYTTIAQTVAAGMTAWTDIKTAPDVQGAPQMYFGSIINTQNLALLAFFF